MGHKYIRMIAFLVLIFLLAPDLSHSCTSFAFSHKGYLIFGTNYDNSFAPGLIYINKRNVEKSGWEPGTDGKIAAWVSRYGSVTFSCVGYQLAWAGMNEAGLVISTMSLSETKSPRPDERPPLISPLWIQYILDTCGTSRVACASVQIDGVEYLGGILGHLVLDQRLDGNLTRKTTLNGFVRYCKRMEIAF